MVSGCPQRWKLPRRPGIGGRRTQDRRRFRGPHECDCYRSGPDRRGRADSAVEHRQLETYPGTGGAFLYLAITVLATVTLYYELYVGGAVATLLLTNLHMSFAFYVVILAFGLAAYPNPAAIPPKLAAQAVAAAGGGAKGTAILATIGANGAAIKGVIAAGGSGSWLASTPAGGPTPWPRALRA